MTDIRTPDDEKPAPWLYPPFLPGRIYHAATYRGHSNGAIDLNRRSPTGAWLQDEGDPVLAAQDGRVVERNRDDGLVKLDHGDGLVTEYRHMKDITVKLDERVERGDRIGSIGNVAGSGSSFGPHLHFKVTRNGKPIQVQFEGKPVRTSVLTSDTKPVGWEPPDPVVVVGPPPKATWKGAFQQALQERNKAQTKVETQALTIGNLNEELKVAGQSILERDHAIETLQARVTELEAATPPDCAQAVADEKARILGLVSDGVDALVAGLA